MVLNSCANVCKVMNIKNPDRNDIVEIQFRARPEVARFLELASKENSDEDTMFQIACQLKIDAWFGTKILGWEVERDAPIATENDYHFHKDGMVLARSSDYNRELLPR